MRELMRLRDEFRRRFVGVDGLVSVGFGKTAEGTCLRVVVDRSRPEPLLPRTFRGLPVRVELGSPAVLAIGSAAELTAS